MNDQERFHEQMLMLGTVFNRQIDTVMLDAWWRACASVGDEQFERAVHDLVSESEYFPTPAQVRARAYRLHEERQNGYGDASGIPGVALLTPGPLVDASRREGLKYCGAHLVEAGLIVPLYTCLPCRDRRHVRIDAAFASPHFGRAIPCPKCHGDAYDGYVERHGIPDGMPKWSR